MRRHRFVKMTLSRMLDFCEFIFIICRAFHADTERWQSGRMRHLGKVVCPIGHHGFESRSLRHDFFEIVC